MSESLNTTKPKAPRVLMVVSNPGVSTTVGGPVGFWASELWHAFHEFREAGYDVKVASPQGGRCEYDALGDPRDASRYSAEDVLSLGYIHHGEFSKLVENTASIDDLRTQDFDALVVVGGQGPMFTFPGATNLHALIRDFYEAGKPTAALCHGTNALLFVTLSDGAPLVRGKTMTGFANSEEDFADEIVGQKVMPFRIEDEAKKLGANFITGGRFTAFAVNDGHLITGQQQYSGKKTAELVVRALGA